MSHKAQALTAQGLNLEHTSVMPRRLSRRKELLLVLLMSAAGAAAVSRIVIWRFGSIAAGIARANGQSLLADGSVKSLDGVPPNGVARLEFKIRNLTGHPIRLQGAQTSCSCATVEQVPQTLKPWSEGTIVAHIQTDKAGVRMKGAVSLITDEPNHPTFDLGYSLLTSSGPRVTPSETDRAAK